MTCGCSPSIGRAVWKGNAFTVGEMHVQGTDERAAIDEDESNTVDEDESNTVCCSVRSV